MFGSRRRSKSLLIETIRSALATFQLMSVWREKILYILCGLLTFGIDFNLYNLLVLLSMPISLSKGMSFICSLLVSFNLNRTFVFRYKGTDSRFQRFLILANVNLVVNVLINEIALKVLGFDNINICFIIATGLTVICSFLGMKLWVFRTYASIADKSG